jgi:hypothetical protein
MSNTVANKVVSKAISEIYGTSHTDTAPKCGGPLTSGAERRVLTESEGIRGACFACYLENTLHNTIHVLKMAGQLASENANKKLVEEGIAIAEESLEGLLDELNARSHGQGLPNNMVPIRGVPYVVNTKKK